MARERLLRERNGAGLVARFAQDARGNVAMIFGLCLIPMVAAMGATLDYIAASTHRANMQVALDAAALAGARALDQDDPAVRKVIENWVAGSADKLVASAKLSIAIDRSVGKVTVSAAASMPTTFMPIVGIANLDIGTTAEVVQDAEELEVALVMDNTGSMASNNKLQAMKDAATTLVDTLVKSSRPNAVKFAVVPFSTFVNVGPTNRTAAWIDNTNPGKSPIHSEIFSAPTSRFALYDALKISWKGCVEARPAPYDTDDTAPTTGTPATLFVPAFGPDEPDTRTRWGSALYPNNYIDDVNVNVAGPQPTGYALDLLLQANLAKYTTSRLFDASRATTSTTYGPNYGCGIQPVTPLTTDSSKVKNAIKAMVATGWTNIAEGAIWGLRVLSPELPFAEGAPWSKKEVRKIIVLLTDGKNEIGQETNANGVEYNAYGYLWNKRLGLDVGASYDQIQKKLNDKTTTSCATAKAKGVTIYTVRLEERDQGVRAVLQTCASRSDYFFDAPSASDLQGVFKQIAAEIGKLRLSR